MYNVCPEGTEYQHVTSPSGEALWRNVHVRRSERIRNSPQRYNPVFGDAREWKNGAVASIVYMIQDRDLNSNVDTEDSYCYWLSGMQKIVWICHQRFILEHLMFSILKSMILILQRIWRHYQGVNCKNSWSQWMMKLKVLWEGTHGWLFQGIQLIITMFFQEHGISSIRGNLIGQSENSRHDIV